MMKAYGNDGKVAAGSGEGCAESEWLRNGMGQLGVWISILQAFT